MAENSVEPDIIISPKGKVSLVRNGQVLPENPNSSVTADKNGNLDVQPGRLIYGENKGGVSQEPQKFEPIQFPKISTKKSAA